MSKWHLKRNPFSKKAVRKHSDYKYELTIKTNTMKRFLNEYDFGLNPDGAIQEILIGDRGCGKTTDLLTIKHFIDTTFKDKNIHTAYVNRYFRLPNDSGKLFGFIPTQQTLESFINEESVQEMDDYIFGNKDHYFLFIDTPDDYIHNRMTSMIAYIDKFLYFDNIHIYIAFTHDTFVRCDRENDVLGKIAHTYMPPFSLDEIKQMVMKRLTFHREESFEGDDYYPFTDDALLFVHERSKGNPRMALTFLAVAIADLNDKEFETIGKREMEMVFLREDFRKEILQDRVNDKQLIELFETLLNEISNKFEGYVGTQKELTDYMTEKYNWGNKTTIKRLNRLIDYGLIEMSTGKDLWTKTYRLR